MTPILRFPLVSGEERRYPRQAVCGICGKVDVDEPREFVLLAVGALTEANPVSGRDIGWLRGFFGLWWHGSHVRTATNHDDSRINFSTPEARVQIVEDAAFGQADLMFCSTTCLRRFFSEVVDELENRVAVAKAGA